MTDKPIDIPFTSLVSDTSSDLTLEVLNPPSDVDYGDLLMGMGKVGDAIWVVGGLGYNEVLSSSDGTTFEELDGDLFSGGEGLRMLRSSGSEAWVCGEWGYIARSTDAGASWTKVPTGVNNCCWSIAIDEHGGVWGTADNGWVGYCTDGETWESVQRGDMCTDTETWKKYADGMPGGIAWAEPSALGVLLPADRRLLIGNRGTVELTSLESEDKLMHAVVTPAGSLVVVGQFGCIYRSEDQGATFTRVQGPTTYKRPPAKKGRPPMERQTHLHRIYAFDDGRLVATGDRGLLLVSHDDGRSFSKVEIDVWDEEPDDNRLYALGVVDGVMLVGTGATGILGIR